ncbi:hypothetical protein GIS00_00775 [Nakamurella sp. YIM 132087]|uniref:Uncharacterized protein n=1 Tax=Nakamurella alba TaxID=2665158 RepID=A0A7K1FEH1_9ACTN|nr:hypothetical protein [Nakamurella alba]MTD12476.1 hypothetical protein [Nakamurella alba]
MITRADFDFHTNDGTDRTWTETIGGVFSVPEAGILANVYVLARPNLGVVTSCVNVHQGLCTTPYEIDFHDPQVHLPCPSSFSSFTLDSGMGVEVDSSGGYRMTYRSADGNCSFDLDYSPIMAPWDMHDPATNPLLPADGLKDADTGLGAGWAHGHFDLINEITGTLRLRGREYEVRCTEGMDHSWGPRPETGGQDVAVTWLHVTFGRRFGMHLAAALEIEDGEVRYGPVRFGYVVEDGEVTGIESAEIIGETDHLIPVRNHITARDARGREWEFGGASVGGAPWYSWNPFTCSFSSLMRYESGTGEVGHSMMTDVYGLEFLADRMSRHGISRRTAHPGGTR